MINPVVIVNQAVNNVVTFRPNAQVLPTQVLMQVNPNHPNFVISNPNPVTLNPNAVMANPNDLMSNQNVSVANPNITPNPNVAVCNPNDIMTPSCNIISNTIAPHLIPISNQDIVVSDPNFPMSNPNPDHLPQVSENIFHPQNPTYNPASNPSTSGNDPDLNPSNPGLVTAQNLNNLAQNSSDQAPTLNVIHNSQNPNNPNPQLLTSQLDSIQDIDLDELSKLVQKFKDKRVSLNLTQSDVRDDWETMFGVCYSQSAMCRVEKLDITTKQAKQIMPVIKVSF